MENLRKYITSLTTFSNESWEILLECMTAVSFRKNEHLLSEGQLCEAIFFINSGYCKAVHNVDGKEINTAFYFENEFATNMKSLRSSTPSDCAIRACEKVSAIRIDKNKLLDAYGKSHEIESFGRKVLELLLAKQEEHSDSFKLLSPKQRFDYLTTKYPGFLQRVSLTQTASYLGISRETLSRFRASG